MNAALRVMVVMGAVLGVAAQPAAAQRDDYFHRHSRLYGAVAVGAGQFKLVCDSCPGTLVNANLISGWLGYSVTPRIRVEVGAQYMARVGERSHGSNLTAGLVVYPVGNLFLRGAVSSLSASWEDTVGVVEGKGGPGFAVGVGYDLYLGSTFALTPFANYFGGKITNLQRDANLTTTLLPGTLTAYNAGIALTWKRRIRNQ